MTPDLQKQEGQKSQDLIKSNGNATEKAREQKDTNYNKTNPFAALDNILYPPIAAPYHKSTLAVSPLHNISYYLYGNPDGEPALFLHGGPGAGCFPNHARFFNPSHYQIVLVDQRGCGNSTPRGEIRNNTLMDLVHDCELLKDHLHVSKWKVVLGGSWGTTLAIAYAQEYSDSVGALVLRGLCLLRTKEVDWLFGDNGGASKLNPDAWQTFSNFATEYRNETTSSDDGRSVLHSYYDLLLSSDPEIRLQAAMYWSLWERNISLFQTNTDPNITVNDTNSPHLLVWDGSEWAYRDETDLHVKFDSHGLEASVEAAEKLRKFNPTTYQQEQYEEDQTISSARTIAKVPETTNTKKPFQYPIHIPNGKELPIPVQNMLTCFYSVNNSHRNEVFGVRLLDEKRMSKIKSIPCIVIQGGQDNICPPDSALDFFKGHLNTENVSLRIPLNAGHSMYNPSISKEIVRATDFFSRQKND